MFQFYCAGGEAVRATRARHVEVALPGQVARAEGGASPPDDGHSRAH